jgi:hypothetical protein
VWKKGGSGVEPILTLVPFGHGAHTDKISLKFYTDPDFFFRKWVTEQQEMLKAAKADKKEKRYVRQAV